METDKGLLEAHRQGASDDIKKIKVTQNLGSGAESPYLDMVLSICKICLSLTLVITGKWLRAHQKCVGKWNNGILKKAELSFAFSPLRPEI